MVKIKIEYSSFFFYTSQENEWEVGPIVIENVRVAINLFFIQRKIITVNKTVIILE